ncbi:MAG: glycerophosphodiester phosphodiesterase [Colwellia sp.]|jgi:glycerophosphoryl diester phosphodiesterase
MKIIAHRGASGEFPENTLLAFEQAIKQQADGIELDAQYHQSSGQFVLLHDAFVINNAGQALSFEDFSLEALLAITHNNQATTTLDKALATINGQCLVNIELKATTSDKTLITTIVDALKKLLNGFIERKQFTYSQLVISAFNHPLLLKIKRDIPQVSTAALIAHCPLTFDEFKQTLQVKSVNPSIHCLNQNLVNSIHQQGLAVWVYTVDREQDIQQCMQLGVDAIFTNYPTRTRLIVNKKQKNNN